MAEAEGILRVALVGSGSNLLGAIEALQGLPGVLVTVIADVSGHGETKQLADRLGVTRVTNPMEVFRTGAELILELNGDDRQYERLLAVKPSRIEVMGAHGAGVLISLLRERGQWTPGEGTAAPRPETGAEPRSPDRGGEPPDPETVGRDAGLPAPAAVAPPVAPPGRRALIIVAANRQNLYEYLKEGLKGIAGLDVIVDRRKGASRKPPRDQGPASDERRQDPADPELRARGFVISRPPEGGTA